MFRKAVNVTDQLPLVSALSGKTHLFEFDNFMNYNFSDPFLDVAFVQLTPGQIWKAQKLDFHFLPMNLNLYHDIYDKSVDTLINGKDVVIAKQLPGGRPEEGERGLEGDIGLSGGAESNEVVA